MSVKITRRVQEVDALSVLKAFEGIEASGEKDLVVRAWSTSTGFGYCVRDNKNHERVAAFEVLNITSRINVWLGFNQDFDPVGWNPLLGVENVNPFASSYLFEDKDKACQAILAWIYDSKLLDFSLGEKPPPKPKPVKVVQPILEVPRITELPKDVPQPRDDYPVFPIKYVAKRPERNYAVGGKRKRDNTILEILELAEERVVAYEIIHEWFFGNHSAKETVRRLQRIFRYGWTLHVIPVRENKYFHIWFRSPEGKLIDIKLLITAEHAARLRKHWFGPKDSDFNHDAYVYVITRKHAFGYKEYLSVDPLKWSTNLQDGEYLSYECFDTLLALNPKLDSVRIPIGPNRIGSCMVQLGKPLIDFIKEQA